MLISGISVFLLFCIGGLHVFWAFGGKWGSKVAIPSTSGSREQTFIPGSIATLIVAILLFSGALLLAIHGHLLPTLPSSPWVQWGCWVCVFVFGLRAIGDFKYVGIFKRVKQTRFATYDTFLFTPLCLWLCFTFYYTLIYS
ncbi:fatty acid desaturase [Paenibacillus sp. V4I3]|uniref:DUF3995 domain-containing protein n=1 Tax=unclassified Paenibacillus TaxID=185978 RepID=UPI002788CC98|nr:MULTISPECIES: DUF3995 domain-containing protein [unclassified Paenibacillus]MDQ0876332.1 fatty acid desaturase [Paenibacillus sp. V4I3]MDQ0887636.1 fatty acid desaturase [Paenibacillus sp. V4I9]